MNKYSLTHLVVGFLLALASTTSLDGAKKNLLKREHSSSPVLVENPLLKHRRVAPPADELIDAPLTIQPSTNTLPARTTVLMQPAPAAPQITMPIFSRTMHREAATVRTTTSGAAVIASLPATVPTVTNLIEDTKTGNVLAVKHLLSSGADVNQVDDEGFTALIWATCKGHLKIVRLLLDAGADPNATSRKQRVTAYMYAHFYKKIAIARSLKEHIVRQCGDNEELARSIMIQQELALIESRGARSTKANLCPILTQEIAPVIAQVSAKMGGPEHFTIKYDNSISPSTCPATETIFITSQVIRQLLTNIPEGKKEQYSAIFADIIAHEIGHNIDPEWHQTKAVMENRNTFFKKLLSRLTTLNLSVPALLLALAHSDTHIELATAVFTGAMCGSTALVALNQLNNLRLQRKLEYNADRLSLTGGEDVATAPARWAELFKNAERYMHDLIKTDCANALSQAKDAFVQKSPSMLWEATKTAGLAGCKWLYMHGPNWIRIHPHDEKRIKHIQKHAKLMTGAANAAE